jgi:hypothetical protein
MPLIELLRQTIPTDPFPLSPRTSPTAVDPRQAGAAYTTARAIPGTEARRRAAASITFAKL